MPPTQLYSVSREGNIFVFDPLTLATPTGWASNFLQPFPGPALGGFGIDPSTSNLYLCGIPGSSGSYLYPVGAFLDGGGQYFLGGIANPATMPAETFLPEFLAIDGPGQRVFVADDRRMLTAWSTSTFAALAGSPYYPSNGTIKAQGVAYNSAANRVYVCCQTDAGQDQVVVYNAATAPMTPIAGSPFNVSLGLSQSSGAMAFDAVNNRLLIACSLGLVALNGTTLAPIAGSPFATGGSDPRALVIDTVQSRVYVANFGSDSLAALALSTLAPIAGSPYAVGHSPGSLAFSATVNRLYVGCYGSNPGGIHLFNPSTAPMTQVAGSPFYSGSQFVRLAVGP